MLRIVQDRSGQDHSSAHWAKCRSFVCLFVSSRHVFEDKQCLDSTLSSNLEDKVESRLNIVSNSFLSLLVRHLLLLVRHLLLLVRHLLLLACLPICANAVGSFRSGSPAWTGHAADVNSDTQSDRSIRVNRAFRGLVDRPRGATGFSRVCLPRHSMGLAVGLATAPVKGLCCRL